MSKKTNNVLTRQQERALEDWVVAYKEALGSRQFESYDIIATAATKSLGFSVTVTNIRSAAATMNIVINCDTAPHSGFGQIWRAIQDLQQRTRSLESLIEIQTAPSSQTKAFAAKQMPLASTAGSTNRI